MALDDKGSVATDGLLKTDHPAVFAIRDVRAKSFKRVVGSVGEGLAVVARIHAYVAHRGEEPPQPRPPVATCPRGGNLHSGPAATSAQRCRTVVTQGTG